MFATSTACGSRFADRAAAALLAILLSGCAPRPVPAKPAAPSAAAPVAPPVAPPPVPFVAPVAANVELVVDEAVAGPEEDTASFTKVFIDGKEAGKTEVGMRSQERRWAGHIDPGNHLFRFEQWYLPKVGEWNPLDAQWQPTERFIRVEPGERTTVVLKFSESTRRSRLSISRAPLP